MYTYMHIYIYRGTVYSGARLRGQGEASTASAQPSPMREKTYSYEEFTRLALARLAQNTLNHI